MANIPISSLPTVTSVGDNDYLAVDNGSTSSKITVKKFNETGTASAQTAATAAANSATAAAGSAATALTYKNAVEQAINDASTIVSNAQTYANAAESSKNDASGYASAASTSASQAATSVTQAASYASGVQEYAIEAKSWAEGGTGTRVDEETTNCQYYANAAHTSEQNAASSESNAATSESNAADSATAAAASESSVETNALKAEGYAVGTQDGVEVESGTYFHNNAKYYKEQAASSESNAASSEYNAGLSETAAAASETAAKGSEEDSEAWAWGKVDGVDVPASHPAYHNNAKYWADAASGAAGGGVTSFNSRSGAVVPAAGDYSANIVDFDNSTNGFTATDTQAAIEEVQGNVDTLDSSLASVAKSGAYSDLSGTPSLATVATSGSYSDLSNTPSLATVATSGSYSDLSNTPTLGTAAAKDVPASGNASTAQVVLGSDTRLSDSRTPSAHATSSTTYGGGTATNYGHNKLTDSYSTSSGVAAANSVGASGKAVYDLYTALKTSTRKTVNTSSWSTDTSSQSGTTLYKKSISLSHVYVDSPTVEISTSSGTGLPTTAQQDAYNLLQYATVDGTTLYLYSSAIPSTTYYIQIGGVD